MILYKYVSFDAARKIISSNTLGFSHLKDFNDPFECTYFDFSDNPAEGNSSSAALRAYRNRFSEKYGVLSLTRHPLNALMWSHYGDSHRGIVIGVDVDCTGFTDLDNNIIPSQLGDVIYVSSKSSHKKSTPTIDELFEIGTSSLKFSPTSYNIMKKAFLYKSLEWAYEEEVRVVKSLNDVVTKGDESYESQGSWSILENRGQKIYCYKLVENSIKEVYLGRNVYENVSKYKSVSCHELNSIIKSWKDAGMNVYACDVSRDSWSISKKEWSPKH